MWNTEIIKTTRTSDNIQVDVAFMKDSLRYEQAFFVDSSDNLKVQILRKLEKLEELDKLMSDIKSGVDFSKQVKEEKEEKDAEEIRLTEQNQ